MNGRARALNIFRTHYTKSQIGMFAAKMANLKRGDVKSQLKQACVTVSTSDDRITTAAEAAKVMGVSETTVNAAKRVRRER
jgi:hypothetical protein